MYSKLKGSKAALFSKASASLNSASWAQSAVIVSLPPLKLLLLMGALTLVPFALVDHMLRTHVVSLVMSLDLWGYLREARRRCQGGPFFCFFGLPPLV